MFGMSLKKVLPRGVTPGYIPFCELNTEQAKLICPVVKKIKIPAKCKNSILEELDLLNINKGFLFPELEYQAKNVTEYVKRKINV